MFEFSKVENILKSLERRYLNFVTIVKKGKVMFWLFFH